MEGDIIKKILNFLFVFSSTVLLSSCGTNIKQEELIKYLNKDMEKVAELEIKVNNDYNLVSGDNFTNDEIIYNKINDEIIPNSLKLVGEAESITLQDDKIKNVHELYISFVNKQNQAFTLILSALETKDNSKITEANERLSDSKKDASEYAKELDKLKNEYNVDVE